MFSLALGAIGLPISILLGVGLFFFVLKMPRDLGIYLGWLPSLALLIMSIFLNLYYLFPLLMALVVYITATVLRINKNKKIKEAEENKLKEIDIMSINDL